MKIKFVLLMVFAVSLLPAAQADVIGHWKFDEGTGTTATDSSGNGNDGTITSPSWTSGVHGGAIQFNGSSTVVNFGEGPSLDGTVDFTVAAWIKTTATATGVIIQQRDADSNGWYGQYQLRMNGDGTLSFYVYNAWNGYQFNFKTTQTVNDGLWHHVAAVRDGTEGRIYIDGGIAASEDRGELYALKDYITVAVGSNIRGNNQYFNGVIDDVYLLNEALDTNDIIGLMDAGLATLVSPNDREQNVLISNVVLEWATPSGYEPTGYDLYFGSDVNELSPTYWLNTKILDKQLTNTYAVPEELQYNTTYYWRVDTYEPNSVGPDILHKGAVWSFTAIPPDPVILAGPNSITVPAGSTVQLSVDTLQGETFTWYRTPDKSADTPDDDVQLQTGSSNILILDNVQLEPDEAYYYCVVENSIEGSSPVVSPLARVMTARLISYWKFDENTADSEAGWDAVLGNEDPNFVRTYEDGIDGKAIRFNRSGDQLVVPGSEEYFNFYPQGFTITFWAKPDNYDTVNGFMTYVAKRSGNTGWNMFDTAFYYGQGYSASIYPLGLDTPAGRLDDGNWHFLACTYDPVTQTMKVYQEGVLAGTPQTGEVTPGSDGPVTFGSYNATGTGGWGYKGLLDDVRIYNYPLSPAEIAKLYTDFAGGEICVDINDPSLQYDFNHDCKVDFADFAMFASQWLACNLVPDCLP